jgi:trafficking protein particle complex subunit 9
MVITVDLTAEPYEHVIYEGSLTDIAVGALEPSMSAKITVPICFVSCGRFEINADARIWGIMGEDSKVGSGKLRADVRDI